MQQTQQLDRQTDMVEKKWNRANNDDAGGFFNFCSESGDNLQKARWWYDTGTLAFTQQWRVFPLRSRSSQQNCKRRGGHTIKQASSICRLNLYVRPQLATSFKSRASLESTVGYERSQYTAVGCACALWRLQRMYTVYWWYVWVLVYPIHFFAVFWSLRSSLGETGGYWFMKVSPLPPPGTG